MPKSILVADDSATIQEAIKLAFATESDISLRFVEDGDSALREARSGSYDVVFCDHHMPGLDGYELAEALRDDPQTAHLPLLLLTGSFKAYDEARAKQIGIDDQIKKPFRVQPLLEKTRTLLAKAASRPAAPAANVYHATENATMIAPVPQPPSSQPPMMTNPFVPAVASPFAPPPLPTPARVNPFMPQPAAASSKPNPFAPPPAALGAPKINSFVPAEPARNEAAGPSIVLGENQAESENVEMRPTSTLLGMPVLNLNNQQNKPGLRPPAPPVPSVPPPVPPPIRQPPLATNRGTLPAPKPVLGGFPQPPTFRPVVPARPESSPRLPVPTSLFEDEKSQSIVSQEESAPKVEATQQLPIQPMPEDSSPAEVVVSPELPAEIESVAAASAPVEEPRYALVQEAAPEEPKRNAPSTASTTDAPVAAVSEEQLRTLLAQTSREVIERIVWEVVPDLAESIIRAELQRLLAKLPQS